MQNEVWSVARLVEMLQERPSDEDLRREISAPSVSSVRNPFPESQIKWLSPSRISLALDESARGETDTFIGLLEDIEERDAHMRTVIQKRRSLFMSCEQTLHDRGGKVPPRVMEAVQQLIDDESFGDLKSSLMDAVHRGFAVCEIVWDRTASMWWPQRYAWRDQRYFSFDRERGQKLLLKSNTNPAGEKLPWAKFVQYRYTGKTGLPLRAGLGRTALAYYLLKSYALKDWAALNEIFGIPFRVGKYPIGATSEDVNRLSNAISDLSSDASATIPDNMSIELVTTGGVGSAEVFARMIDWVDSQISKLYLGQTMTTDVGANGSRAQAQVHQDDQGAITDMDCSGIQRAIQRDVIDVFCAINFGENVPTPKLCIYRERERDHAALANVYAVLGKLGVPLSLSQIREELSLRTPQDEQDLLVIAQPTSSAPKLDASMNARAQDEIDAIIEEVVRDDWNLVLGPVVDPVLEYAKSSMTKDEYLSKIERYYADMDVSSIVRRIATQTMKARVIGASNGR